MRRAERSLDPARLRSKSKNTPFLGREVKGRVLLTLAQGCVVYGAERLERSQQR